MTEIKRLWGPELPAFPGRETAAVLDAAPGGTGQAAACFWLFRYLHRHSGPDETLLGDYCFGLFSAHLALLDSVELNDAFSDFLRRDTLAERSLEDFLGFLRSLPGVAAP